MQLFEAFENLKVDKELSTLFDGIELIKINIEKDVNIHLENKKISLSIKQTTEKPAKEAPAPSVEAAEEKPEEEIPVVQEEMGSTIGDVFNN